MKSKLTIYLADLANTKFGYSPPSIPLGIGFIKSYVMAQLPNDVDISLFKDPELFYEAIKNKQPDIAGFSWYAWNYVLTTDMLTHIKSSFPDILTVLGGANVSENAENRLKDFKHHPCIDVMVPNEGELPFVNLLKVFLQGGKPSVFKTVIDGCFYLSNTKKQVVGNPMLKRIDVNSIPSPYLEGYLDNFLQNKKLIPIIQTVRGCPYSCSFCVSSKKSWNKITIFNIERVKEEIDYLESHAENKQFFLTDENFGLIARDIDVAKYIAEKRAKGGYPHGVRGMYTDKSVNNRIKEITLLLKGLIPLNISFQTTTEAVLKDVGRKNYKIEKVKEAVNWAHKNNITVTTELIFGLPHETYESFMNVVDTLVGLRFDSIALGTLLLLKETRLCQPESIDRFGYKILHSVAERGYTRFNGFESIEVEDYAIENNYFSFEEFINIKLFAMIFELLIFLGYFKEMVYVWDNRGVKLSNVVSEVLKHLESYPVFSRQIERLKQCLFDNMFKTREEVQKVYSQRFSDERNSNQYIGFTNPYILGKIIQGELIHPSNQEKMIDEIVNASITVFNKSGKGSLNEFLEEIKFAKVLVRSCIIPFWEMPKETVFLSSPYDLIGWREKDYHGKLCDFRLDKPIEYQLEIRSIKPYNSFVSTNSKKPFYLQSEFFFRTFRSNNMRRYMSSDEFDT